MSEQISDRDVLDRARRIKLLLMDCDGVLTDGKLYFSAGGEEMKAFHIRDGQGIVSWHRAGFTSGVISGRDLKILQTRAAELGIKYVKGSSVDKTKDLEDILRDAQVSSDEVAYIGDDIGDIDIMKKVGLPVAVADAASEVLPFALFVTKTKGGCGAVRELTDVLLAAKKGEKS
jgi:3-deoxy-D-manno-octulosonate 8-phosphate phosphatase (KDO 8-P phosphatase)